MTTEAPARRTKLTSEDHRSADIWWSDYCAHDFDGAKDFFAKLWGWTYEKAPADNAYELALANGNKVAGIMPLSDEMKAQGIPPVWTPYVNVDDAAATCAKIKDLGGTVLIEPVDVDNAGWMAVASDPTGATFGLWQPREHTGADLINSPGALCWTEVRSSDMAAAKVFYTQLFGWETKDLDMGPVPYVQFSNQGAPAAGMCPWEGEGTAGVPSHWALTFGVKDIAAALELVEADGGKVTWGPQEIPFGIVASIMDPQGGHVNIIQLNG